MRDGDPVVTPELRFDEDGFLDLSVFPDTEPDVYGHGPAVLDPLLAEDRKQLDADVDGAWIAGAIAGLDDGADADHAAHADERLDALVPSPVEPAAATPTVVADAGSTGDEADDDIEIASLLRRLPNGEGSTGEGPAS